MTQKKLRFGAFFVLFERILPQTRIIKRIALANIARLITLSKPVCTLGSRSVRKRIGNGVTHGLFL